MPIVKPSGVPSLAIEAELIDNISKKLDGIDRELDDITANRKARDAQAARDSVNSAKSQTNAWTEFRSAYSTVLDIVRTGQQVWNATAGEFVEYAEQVKNLSRSLGASAEDTSRLIQVADDVRISYDSLKIAMKEAQKDGIEPSIESLAKLSDQYLAIQSPAERTKFLLETFGKSGLEMGKLMEKGGDGIRAMNEEISNSLIITEEGIKASDDYQRSLDQLEEVSQAVEISFGSKLIPVMNAFMRIVLADIEAVGVFKDVLTGDKSLADAAREVADIINKNGFEVFGLQIGDATEAMKENADTSDQFTGAMGDNEDAVKAAEQAIKDFKDSLEEMSQANIDAEKFIQSYADFSKDYAENHAEAVDKVKKAEEELAAARKEFGAGSEQAAGAAESLAEAQKGVQELEASWHESTQKMIYDMVLAKLSVDGLTDAEFKAAQDLAVSMGLRTEAQAEEAKAAMDKAESIAEGIALQEDVMKEKAAQDEELLRLEQEKELAAGNTAATVVDGAAQSAEAQAALASQIDATTQALGRQADAARLAAQAMQYSAGSGTAAPAKKGGGGGSGGKRDSGGVGIAGVPYVINPIASPEVFVPDTNGKFIPNVKGSGETKNITIVVNNPKKEAAERSIEAGLKKLSYLGVA